MVNGGQNDEKNDGQERKPVSADASELTGCHSLNLRRSDWWRTEERRIQKVVGIRVVAHRWLMC